MLSPLILLAEIPVRAPLHPGAAFEGRPRQAPTLLPLVWKAPRPGHQALLILTLLLAHLCEFHFSGGSPKLQCPFMSIMWPTGRSSHRVTGEEKLLKPPGARAPTVQCACSDLALRCTSGSHIPPRLQRVVPWSFWQRLHWCPVNMCCGVVVDMVSSLYTCGSSFRMWF